MQITNLTPKGKRQTVIWLDGEPAGFLDNRDVSSYRLEIDTSISEADWEKIVSEVILPRGKRKALELLQVQDRTVKELHEKLLASDYSESQSWEIIAYVASFHYIDEQRYAVNYVRAHAKTKSAREMQMVLMRKGIEQDIFRNAYEQYQTESSDADDGEEEESPEIAAVRQFVAKRVRGNSMSEKERQKIYAGLQRKGFAGDAIRRVLSEYEWTRSEE
ncbi:MAG: RecX family transcriptional regulator [Lachnospiraceae bacterium]|nr:RecX family transcriptional regulator [Lachnospiraceae bacterium]